MRNVRKASEHKKIAPASKKVVKRLKPNNSIGSALMKILEPALPFPRRTTKFESPYKSPQIYIKKAAKTNEKQQAKPTTIPHQNSAKNLVQNQAKSSTTTIKQNSTKPAQTSKLGEEARCESLVARNEKVIRVKSLSSLPKVSPVKIQPIDPYKFCEPIIKDCAQRKGGQKDTLFKRTKDEQRRVNQEALALIKRTAEAIRVIRSQHEEWKRKQQ